MDVIAYLDWKGGASHALTGGILAIWRQNRGRTAIRPSHGISECARLPLHRGAPDGAPV